MVHHKRLSESERKKILDCDGILLKTGLKGGMTFIDLGCGEGSFAIPAARLVGSEGTVHGIDIDEEAIHILNERACQDQLNNLHAVQGDAERTVICDGCADVVFLANCLHDFSDPRCVLGNAKRMLKPSGLLADLDWKKVHMDFGPPYDIRFSEEKTLKLIENAGFVVETLQSGGPYHYLILAKLQN
jgi:ubiquinone/menaquinone biosynthesis C-methylase UbiE